MLKDIIKSLGNIFHGSELLTTKFLQYQPQGVPFKRRRFESLEKGMAGYPSRAMLFINY
jgi:hypothetical protein